MKKSTKLTFSGTLLIMAVVTVLLITGCSIIGIKGGLTLSLTDSPIDDSRVTGVWITVESIEVNLNEEWQTIDEFAPTGEPVNLLDLTNGVTALLGTDMRIPAGQYNQIRFMLGNSETSGGSPTTGGCYITFDDDTSDDDVTDPFADDTYEGLFTASGAQSGYKAVGAFRVPINGTVEITADFDVRKAVVETGGSRYILKPTIKLIVDGEAGQISGTVVEADAPTFVTGTVDTIVIHIYEDDTYAATELELDATDEEAVLFPTSVASAAPDDDGEYVAAFLAAGTYDLIIAAYDADGEFLGLWGEIPDVEVTEKGTTPVDVDASTVTTS